MTGTISIGFAITRTDPDQIALMEELGADSLWVGGHIASTRTNQEPLAELARLSALSNSCELGTATLVLPLYPPALVAKQVALLDAMTAGRVTLGVGAGGDEPSDFLACQVPIAERSTRTDEAIAVLRALWSGQPVHHQGQHFTLPGIQIVPGPGGRTPPIVIAGRRKQAISRAALLGDGWMPYLYSPRRYAEAAGRIRSIAAAAGRSLAGFRWMLYSRIVIADSTSEAHRVARQQIVSSYGPAAADKTPSLVIAGTAQEVLERLREYHTAGVRHFVFVPSGPGSYADVAGTVLTELAPKLRAGAPRSVGCMS